MKTVLVLAPNVKPYPGGAEIYISNLIEHLPAEEWRVICVTENVPEIKRKNISYIPLIADIERIRSNKTVTWREMYFSLFDQLVELENEKIDIIHANSMEACIIGKILSIQMKAPLVATIHEHMPELKSFGRGRVGLIFDNLAPDAIIAPSSYYFNRTAAYGYDESRIYKVMHGIDAEEFTGFRSKIDLRKKDALNILFVGRVYETKGLYYLVKALVNCDIPVNYHLNVVGPITDASYKEKIDDLVCEYGISDKISFTGAVSPDMVKEYMSASDLMIAPSLDEGFGLAIVEAIFMHIPVIAAKVGGIVDIITDRKEGLLFEPKDVSGLIKCIQTFISDPAMIKKYEKNAFIKASALFRIERMAKETAGVYRKVIKKWEN
ncbi:glycosyltransferase family 4 protein [Ruminococcus flavefaciens]|uniref:Glycosyltransferase involved in cell wall bisynthesis n=1 Tax=Ruminococcus flavefaciens TaxID=1265 RepID=A0A1M7GCA6_RUMFL|nr:glycosyltransferase family 4 protein [Ruminococcus flavefaciens]SHM13930.1 Glycosyltransferase involved in cell wall bisynthesis [Ruminococcus flavefaciens]